MKKPAARTGASKTRASPPALALKFYPADFFPETLPNPFGSYVPQRFAPRFQQAVADRFLNFLTLLDEAIKKPLVVTRTNDCLKLDLFHAFSLVYAPDRQLLGIEFERFGNFVYTDNHFDVTDPLKGEWWLWILLREHGLSFDRTRVWNDVIGSMEDALPYAHDFDRANQWMVDFAREALEEDSIFNRLRLEVQKHFVLETGLLELARQCGQSGQDYTHSRNINRILRYQSPLKRIAEISPGLLPLAGSYLDTQPPIKFMCAPLKTLRDTLLTHYKVSPAAWRYLVKNGSRIFTLPWKQYPNKPAFEIAICFLKTLMHFELPVLPPEPVLEVLLKKYGLMDGSTAPLIGYLPAEVIQIAFTEARQQNIASEDSPFIHEFLRVCAWADEIQPVLDKKQKRKGWPFLLSNTTLWENTKRLYADYVGTSWRSAVDTCRIDRYKIVPLCTGEDLIAEGHAMGHCVGQYCDDCLGDLARFFSVRDFLTNQRVATIQLFKGEWSSWKFEDARGYANHAVGNDIVEIGYELALLYRERYEIEYGYGIAA